jgi:hypothetical protein
MAKYRKDLPQLSGDLLLTDGGIETTLILQEDFVLPEFAAFHPAPVLIWVPLRNLPGFQLGVKAGTEYDSQLYGDAEQLSNEVRWSHGVSLGQPPHCPLPNHGYRFDTLQSSPGTLE